MVQGKITEADTPTIRLSTTPSGLISDPPPSSPIFTPDRHHSWYFRLLQDFWHPAVDAAYCYRRSSVVCMSVGLSQLWALQNGWTDRDAVWNVDSVGRKEPCIRWGAHWRYLANTTEPSVWAAMRPYVKLLRPLLIIASYSGLGRFPTMEARGLEQVFDRPDTIHTIHLFAPESWLLANLIHCTEPKRNINSNGKNKK